MLVTKRAKIESRSFPYSLQFGKAKPVLKVDCSSLCRLQDASFEAEGRSGGCIIRRPHRLRRKAEPNATSPSFQLRRRPSSHRWPVTMYFLYKRMSTYVSQYVRTCVLPHSQVVVSQVFYPKFGRCHKQDRTPFISGVRFRHSLYKVYIRKSCGVGDGCGQWLVQYVYCCLVDTRMARRLITRQRSLLPLEAQSHESEMDVSKLRISKQPVM